MPAVIRRPENRGAPWERSSLGSSACMSQDWHDPASEIRTGVELLLHIFRKWQIRNCTFQAARNASQLGRYPPELESVQDKFVTTLVAISAIPPSFRADQNQCSQRNAKPDQLPLTVLTVEFPKPAVAKCCPVGGSTKYLFAHLEEIAGGIS